jgi:dihydrofolate reductase
LLSNDLKWHCTAVENHFKKKYSKTGVTFLNY